MDDLNERLEQFLQQRNWSQFHSPKNLSMSIAIEAAEVMELFQWLTIEESRKAILNPQFQKALESELADVFIYLVSLAKVAGIDLTKAFHTKMNLNEERFPINASSMDSLEKKLQRTLRKE